MLANYRELSQIIIKMSNEKDETKNTYYKRGFTQEMTKEKKHIEKKIMRKSKRILNY